MLIEVNRTEEEGKKEYKVTPKVSVQENKAVTIDVGEYTEPVEILPPEGKVAMEKVTLTLDNIPSGGSATAYAWVDTNYNVFYFDFDIAPDDITGHKRMDVTDSITIAEVNGDGYHKVSDTVFDNLNAEASTMTRDPSKDFTLWEPSE